MGWTAPAAKLMHWSLRCCLTDGLDSPCRVTDALVAPKGLWELPAHQLVRGPLPTHQLATHTDVSARAVTGRSDISQGHGRPGITHSPRKERHTYADPTPGFEIRLELGSARACRRHPPRRAAPQLGRAAIRAHLCSVGEMC